MVYYQKKKGGGGRKVMYTTVNEKQKLPIIWEPFLV